MCFYTWIFWVCIVKFLRVWEKEFNFSCESNLCFILNSKLQDTLTYMALLNHSTGLKRAQQYYSRLQPPDLGIHKKLPTEISDDGTRRLRTQESWEEGRNRKCRRMRRHNATSATARSRDLSVWLLPGGEVVGSAEGSVLFSPLDTMSAPKNVSHDLHTPQTNQTKIQKSNKNVVSENYLVLVIVWSPIMDERAKRAI